MSGDPYPAAAYRRAREALAVQLADVIHLLGRLDADDGFVAGDELLTLLEDVAARVGDAIAARDVSGWAARPYTRDRPRIDVDTGGRL